MSGFPCEEYFIIYSLHNCFPDSINRYCGWSDELCKDLLFIFLFLIGDFPLMAQIYELFQYEIHLMQNIFFGRYPRFDVALHFFALGIAVEILFLIGEKDCNE